MKLPDLPVNVKLVVDDVKTESLPFLHALRFCLIWLAWVVSLPFSALAAYLGVLSVKLKPELPKKD